MARKCTILGKRGLTGNNVSHSHRKTKRVQQPNLIRKRLYIPEENRTVTIRLSASALRTLNKKGLRQFLKEQGAHL